MDIDAVFCPSRYPDTFPDIPHQGYINRNPRSGSTLQPFSCIPRMLPRSASGLGLRAQREVKYGASGSAVTRKFAIANIYIIGFHVPDTAGLCLTCVSRDATPERRSMILRSQSDIVPYLAAAALLGQYQHSFTPSSLTPCLPPRVYAGRSRVRSVPRTVRSPPDASGAHPPEGPDAFDEHT